MRKSFWIIFLLAVFNIGLLNIKADCEEDRENASFLEVYKNNIVNEEVTTTRIDIMNLTSNLYVTITNNYNNDSVRLEGDALGNAYYDTVNVHKGIKYEINVYSKDSNCKGILKAFDVVTEKYNEFSSLDVCIGHYEDIELCNPFKKVDLSMEDFIKEVNNQINELSKANESVNYVKEYYLYVLGPIVIGLIVFAIKVYLLRRGKENE